MERDSTIMHEQQQKLQQEADKLALWQALVVPFCDYGSNSNAHMMQAESSHGAGFNHHA